jgi:hypothetical protein
MRGSLRKNGAYPTFQNDGLGVTFERGQKTVISVDLSTGVETVLFDTAGSPFEGHQVFLPRLSPDKKAFSSYLFLKESVTLTTL